VLIDNLAKLNRSSRSAVFAALIVIAAIATYKRIVAPHVTYLFAAQQYESVLGDTMKKNKIIINKAKVKKKELQQLREQSVRLQSKLFTPTKAKEFLSDLEVTAKETDCAVYSLNFSTSEPDLENKQNKDASGISANRAMLGVIGVYDNIIRLVEKLQMRTRGVWIDSLKMEAVDGKSPRLKCDMTITIYTIQDKEAAPNG